MERKGHRRMSTTSVKVNAEVRPLEADDQYLKDRASDIGELKRRVLAALSEANPDVRRAAADALAGRKSK